MATIQKKYQNSYSHIHIRRDISSILMTLKFWIMDETDMREISVK